MPSRTGAGARVFAVLEELGWTDGDSVRLAPLLRHLNANRQLVARGTLTAVLYGDAEPSHSLLSTLARRLRVPVAHFHAPRPPKAHAHPLDALDPIDDARTEKRRKLTRRREARKTRSGQ